MPKLLRLIGWIASLLAVVTLACNMQKTPTPVKTPEPPHFCRDFLTINAAGRPAAESQYPSTIANFLTQGGSVDGLIAMLRQWGVVDNQFGSVCLSMTYSWEIGI